jgi:tripartite-type tricarboxylate transporter receptor subunit TctC
MSTPTRRTVIAGLSAMAVTPAIAKSVAWPSRPITLMHGFPPGGPVDTLSRLLAEGLSVRLGQPVMVEPKPGATGTLASGLAAHATPDGYTLVAIPGTYVATAAMFRTLPYRPIDDFTFISTTAEYPLVLVTHPGSPIQTLADILRIARSRPTPLLYGTAGIGSLQHLSMELFAKKANIQLQHVPYKGGAPAITDLLGKRIDLVLDPPTALIEFVNDNKLRALAVTGANRFFGLPNVPTVAESGFPGYAVTAYQGIAAPANLPADIVKKINGAIAVALSDPDLVEKLKKVGNAANPSSPEEYKARLTADIAQWKRVVEDAHLAQI